MTIKIESWSEGMLGKVFNPKQCLENVMMARVKRQQMHQNRDEPVHSFAGFFRDVEDEEIRLDILRNLKQDWPFGRGPQICWRHREWYKFSSTIIHWGTSSMTVPIVPTTSRTNHLYPMPKNLGHRWMPAHSIFRNSDIKIHFRRKSESFANIIVIYATLDSKLYNV